MALNKEIIVATMPPFSGKARICKCFYFSR
jgi:hypothetical protein